MTNPKPLAKKKNKGGRPRAVIDWVHVDDLLKIGGTMMEVSEIIGHSDKTLREAIKDKFNMTFEEYRDQKLGKTKVNLKRAIMDKALSGDTVMMIWASKNLIGWSDKVETDNKHQGQFEVTFEAEWGSHHSPKNVDAID